MAATTAAVIGATAAAASAASSIKSASDARKAGNQRVDIAALDAQAREAARRNAAEGAALERIYNPGAAELRSGSLAALLEQINRPAGSDALVERVYDSAGAPVSVPGVVSFDSPTTRAAAEKARTDLALGGMLPADVRALVARRALANSGTVTGNLMLGRDLVPRDFGLTSLQLEQQRLNNALAAGQQESALEQANAALRQTNAGMQYDASKFARTNLLDSTSLLQSIINGDFSRTLAAANLGQNIAQPQTGLDPGAIANLAVGNTNMANNAQLQAIAARQAANAQVGQLGGQLMGLGAYYQQQPKTTPVTAGEYFKPYVFPGSTGGN